MSKGCSVLSNATHTDIHKYIHSDSCLHLLGITLQPGLFTLCVSDGNTRTRTRVRKGSTVIISNYPSTASLLSILTHFLYFRLHSSLISSHSVSPCCCHSRFHIYIFLHIFALPHCFLSFFFLPQTPTHTYILYFLLFTITFSCSACFLTLCHTCIFCFSTLPLYFRTYSYSSLYLSLCAYIFADLARRPFSV